MRGARSPRGSPAAGSPGGPAAPEITVRHRVLPPRSTEPTPAKRHVAAEGQGHQCFAGRWLVVSEGGDCLLDYVTGTCDVLLNMPLGASCSLVAAMLQFIMAVSPAEGASGEPALVSTHAVMLGGLLLSICRAPGFSVVAANMTPEHELATSSCGPAGDVAPALDAAFRYKAMEIHSGLSSAVGPALRNLAESSSRQREAQLNSYTLSSMLDSADGGPGESIEHLMDLQSSSVARGVFASALSRTYSGLLRQVMMALRAQGSTLVETMCILDHQGQLLARIDDPLVHRASELHGCDASATAAEPFTEPPDWRGAELLKVANDKAGVDSKFTVWCWGCGRLDFIAILGPSVGPLRVGALLRASMQGGVGSASGDSLGVLQLPIHMEVHEGVYWSVLEASRVLAEAFGVSFEWPADIKGTSVEIFWGRDGAGQAGKRGDVVSPPVLDPATAAPVIGNGTEGPPSFAPFGAASAKAASLLADRAAATAQQQNSKPVSPRGSALVGIAPPVGATVARYGAASHTGHSAAVAPTMDQVGPKAAEASAKDYCANLYTRVQTKRAYSSTDKAF